MLHRWAGAIAPVLTGLSLLGFWAMSALNDRSRRDHWAACLRDPESVEWSHAYGAWLPISVLTSAALAALLASAVILTGARAPRWTLILCFPALITAVLALFPASLAVEDHFAFPGSDVSSLNGGPPCGAA
ncbi:hypothetical protein [Actinomadura sp. 9N215]|uniref:hypothetical protein n=1 Tax=Actinomadura sp. 9N215 TaxID=3375150 RepID=UPI0037B87EBD